MNANDKNPSFWRKHAQRYDRATHLLNRRFSEMAALVADDLQGRERVLEVAAGTGLVTLHLAKHVKSLIATDQSRQMLDILKERVQRDGFGNVEVREADAKDLSFADGSFDAVVAANVLHLLDHPEQAVSEFRRVLRPGGTLCVPTFGHGQNALAQLTSRSLSLVGLPIMTRFDQGSLQALVQNAGFSIQRSVVVPGILPLLHVVAKVH